MNGRRAGAGMLCWPTMNACLERYETVNGNFQFGEFQFDPNTGELTPVSEGADVRAARLPPQPAQLLELLISHQPGIVTRQQIQEALWPGVPNDFDRNLHFCVRQIRSALGDSASAPKYVETVPRRGYRLIVNVEQPVKQPADVMKKTAGGNGLTTKIALPDAPLGVADKQAPDNPREDGAKASSSSILTGGRIVFFIVIAVVAIFAVAFSITKLNPFVASDSISVANIQNGRTKIAIMPFDPKEEGFEGFGNGSIALDLLNRLSSEFNQTMDVVGPTTTSRYDQAPEQMLDLVADVQPAFIVNGKFIQDQQQHRLLAEIIRASDGVHVWVKYFESNDDCDLIVDQISDELIRIATNRPNTKDQK